ncbi:MAG: hypothetical protein GF364_09550 [Candidatus Lokiarchaeota archaeon]|nr:hypothetical protein [Candidatus Lokiarchaeota archaeon]
MKTNDKISRFTDLAPIFFGLVYVTSGWDWANLPDAVLDVFWLFTQRGLMMWFLADLFYLSKKPISEKRRFFAFLEFIIFGCGFFISTRVGYGSLLRAIQWEGPIIQHVWGWFQAMLMGVSWGLGLTSCLFLFDNRIDDEKNRKSLMISISIVIFSLIINLSIPLLDENLKKLADMCWIVGLMIASIPIIKCLNQMNKRVLYVNILICVIFFLIASVITSYYEAPPNYAIDRHKIAEITWGFGIGLGLSYAFNKQNSDGDGRTLTRKEVESE